jgi:hypothetical protein
VGFILLGLLACLSATARADTELELLGERFRVSATWRTADGASGAAQAVPLTSETGLFWFFSATNVELIVKVLDACAPPFQSFWVYASGLTDVEVELTVVDTWSGQSKTYHRPRGTLFAPLADTSTFKGCSIVRSCGQGTIAEIAATPRPNAEAEALALLLGPGITADPGIYARLEADLARIRNLRPELADVGFLLIWDPSGLLVELTPSAYEALQAGQLTEWDCLNTWYNGRFSQVAGAPWVVLQFEGFFHPYRIGADYTALPGVARVEANYFGYPSVPISDLCAAIDGAAYDYFFFDAPGNQTLYFRVPQAGAAPVALGSAGPTGPRPDWWPRYEQCRERLYEAASN